MAYIERVKFYNTMVNKKIVGQVEINQSPVEINGLWPGLLPTPEGYPDYISWWDNQEIPVSDYENQWMIEESRIFGGYNNAIMTPGVTAYVNEENILQADRFNSLIYSGIYNSKTSVNNTNVFSVGEQIGISVEPSYGAINLIKSYDTNLIICQEHKISQALVDKDIIYTSEGGTATKPPGVVLGQIIPYVGDYGISNDFESYASYGFRKYFTDSWNGVVLRLSRDGLSVISDRGMRDYFRDKLAKISNDFKFSTVPINGFTDGNGINSIQIGTNPEVLDLGMSLNINGIRQTGQVINISYESQVNNGTGNLTGSLTTNASGITNGVYNNIQPTVSPAGGSGLKLQVSVASNVVSNITSTSPGQGYKVGDVLTIPQASLPGASNDVEITLTFNNDWGFEYSNNFNLQQGDQVELFKLVKDRVIGGWDRRDGLYTLSICNASSSPYEEGEYATITFDEKVLGWSSFYTYKPRNIFSLKNEYFTTFEGSLWKHYDETSDTNRGVFYSTFSPSYIDFIFNVKPSTKKVFKTISYEGSNGFEMTYVNSDPQEFMLLNGSNTSFKDEGNKVLSYGEGLYFKQGQPFRAGFNLKENLYCANLVNSSVLRPGEVSPDPSNQNRDFVSGIKGYFARVKLQTDSSTDVGGYKEIWSVNTDYVASS